MIKILEALLIMERGRISVPTILLVVGIIYMNPLILIAALVSKHLDDFIHYKFAPISEESELSSDIESIQDKMTAMEMRLGLKS